MKNYTMTRARNRRLRLEVERELRGGSASTVEEALDRVLGRPLERGFYVGVDTALVMDRRRRSGCQLGVKGRRRAAMWADLFGQVDSLLASEPGLSRVDAVCRVLAEGTSNVGFCICRERARRAVYGL